MKQSVQKTVDLFGNIDVLVNCLGHRGAISQAYEMSRTDLMDIYETNVMTSFLTYKHVHPVMKKQGSGSILFIAGVFGRRGVPYFSAFATASHAILGFMKSAAMECVSTGIRVNTVCPAPINSPTMYEVEEILAPSPDQIHLSKQQLLSVMPYGRYVEPEEVVESILCLSSDRAKYITGSAHMVDGGMTAK